MKILIIISIINFLIYVPINSGYASISVTKDELEEDWKEIQSVLKCCIGEYKGERTNIETTGFPDGPLLGNGNIGVVSNGTGSWQEFHISSVNFWDGRYTPDPVGEITKTGYYWGSVGVKPLPIGGITIREDIKDGSDIVQYQDMLNAEIRTEAGISIKTWLSATDEIMVSDLTNNSNISIPISVETWTKGDHPYYAVFDEVRWSSPEGKDTIIGTRSDKIDYAVKSGVSGGITWATRQSTVDTTHKFVCRAALATKVVGATVSTSKKGENTAIASFTLRPGETVKVITVIKVAKDGTNPLIEALSKSISFSEIFIDRLHTYHLNWWKNFWLKSYVRMYDEQLEKYYFGALYMTACSNRAGNNPSPLYGPWITTDYPNWKGNYKLSYNFQMTYSGVCSSNRPELLLPYMDLIFDCIPDAQRRSESGYEFNLATGWRWRNSDGTLKFPNGISGGVLYPLGIGAYGVTSEESYSNMISLGTWAAAPCIWYYNITQDQNFLSRDLYPFLKKLAVFWEKYLVKEKGKWVVKYSGASEKYSNDAINSSVDIAVIKYLFSNIIPMSKALGEDESKRNLWDDIVDNMSPLPTRKINGKTVFAESEHEQIKGIAGHLVAYPGREVTLSSDVKIRDVFKNTVDVANRWETMNAPGFLWVVCAHGGYPAEALLERFRALLDKKMLKNLVVRGEGHGTESASSLEYINCSMMNSYEGFIRIFPSWPLSDAKFNRLRASGAFLVSAKKNNNLITDVKIYSEKGKSCTVLNPWPDKNLLVYDRDSLVTSSKINGLYTFNTIQGHSYILFPEE